MNATVSRAPGNDGFWGGIARGFGAGVSTIGRELLPVWAAGQLELQSRDQLERATWSRLNAPPRSQNVADTTGSFDSAPPASGFALTPEILMLAGGAVIAGLLLARM